MKSEKDIQIYKLWWEYLRRSKEYKELCEYYKELLANEKTLMPNKFKIGNSHSDLVETFQVFHNLHDMLTPEGETFTFEIWYQNHKIKCERFLKDEENSIVNDYLNSGDFEIDMKFNLDDFKKRFDRSPTPEEFISYFIGNLKKSETVIFIRVDFSRHRLAMLKSVIGQFISRAVNGSKNKNSQNKFLMCKNLLPTPNLNFESVERYLWVYDLKCKGLSTVEVAEKMGKIKSHNVDVLPEVRRDFRKAKKIIVNVEKGFFPGKY